MEPERKQELTHKSVSNKNIMKTWWLDSWRSQVSNVFEKVNQIKIWQTQSRFSCHLQN